MLKFFQSISAKPEHVISLEHITFAVSYFDVFSLEIMLNMVMVLDNYIKFRCAYMNEVKFRLFFPLNKIQN